MSNPGSNIKRFPVVSIVGRPNVGKSTLFNRLVGSRTAIVDNIPGVTVDRITREVTLGNCRCILVDTGGIDVSPEGIKKQILKQVKKAIDESDVLILVVDGREGTTPMDEEVAGFLRKSGKPVVVAVNKIDEPFMDNSVYEAYRLGFEDVVGISAVHKIGIEPLTDSILKHIPESLKGFACSQTESSDGEKLPIKVAITGRPNAGKSTLLNSIVGYERAIVSNTPGTTRDAIDTYTVINGEEFLFIDTAGIRRRGKIKDIEYYSYVRAIEAINRADIVILLIDGVEGITERDTKISGVATGNFKPVVIAVNKIDMVSVGEMEKLRRQIDLNFDFLAYAPVLFISAKTGKGLDRMIKVVKELYQQYTHRVTTGKLNRFLKDILKHHNPPVYRGKPVKIFYGTQVDIKPPTFIFSVNFPNGITANFKRFIENRIRKELGFENIPLKLVFRER